MFSLRIPKETQADIISFRKQKAMYQELGFSVPEQDSTSSDHILVPKLTYLSSSRYGIANPYSASGLKEMLQRISWLAAGHFSDARFCVPSNAGKCPSAAAVTKALEYRTEHPGWMAVQVSRSFEGKDVIKIISGISVVQMMLVLIVQREIRDFGCIAQSAEGMTISIIGGVPKIEGFRRPAAKGDSEAASQGMLAAEKEEES